MSDCGKAGRETSSTDLGGGGQPECLPTAYFNRLRHSLPLLEEDWGMTKVNVEVCCGRTGVNSEKFDKYRPRCADERNSVAAHFKKAGHNICSFRYTGIEKVNRLPRGGDHKCLLLQRETSYIHMLNTMSPCKMNEDIDIKPFLYAGLF